MSSRTILHITSTIGQGGAEEILKNICQLYHRQNVSRQIVLSLTNDDYHAEVLRGMGVELINIPLRNIFDFKNILLLFFSIKKANADLVLTWMYHGNLVGGIFCRILGLKNIYWNIHHAYIDKNSLKLSTRFLVYLSSFFSYLVPKQIFYCSKLGLQNHNKIFFNSKISKVIFNGYDSNVYKPNSNFSDRLREFYNIADSTFIIGHVARFDPVKDHKNFLSAIKLYINNSCNDIVVVMVGTGVDYENKILTDLILSEGISNKIILLGACNNMAEIYNLFDLCVLSSKAEAFPNVLAESMLCGTPCVSTNVGDSHLILGDYGWICQSKDSHCLFREIETAVDFIKINGKHKIGVLSRNHIISNFDIKKMDSEFLNLL